MNILGMAREQIPEVKPYRYDPAILRFYDALQEKLKDYHEKLNKVAKDAMKNAKVSLKAGKAAVEQSRATMKATRSIRQQENPLKKNVKLLKQQRTETQKSAKAFGSLRSSMTGILALVGIGSLTALATRSIRGIVRSRLDLGVVGGAAQIQQLRAMAASAPLRNILQTVTAVQRQGPFARFRVGRDPEAMRGIAQMTEQLAPLGRQMSSELISSLTAAMEPRQLQGFLRQAGAGDLRGALLGAATGQNVEQVTSVLNALDMVKNRTDPLVESALKLQSAQDRLADLFEKAVDVLASKVVPAVERLAEVIGEWLDRLPDLKVPEFRVPSLKLPGTYQASVDTDDGFIKQAAKDTAKPRNVARIAAQAMSVQNARMIVSGAMEQAAKRVLLPLGVALDAWTIGEGVYQTVQLVREKRQAAKAAEQVENTRRETEARGLVGMQSQDTLTHLKGERDYVRSQIGRGDEAFEPEQFEALRDRYGELSKRVFAMLNPPQTETAEQAEQVKRASIDLGKVWASLRDKAIEAAQQGIEKLREKIDELRTSAQNSRLEQLQQQAARLQELSLTGLEKSIVSELRKLQLEYRSMTPYGRLLTVDDTRRYMDALREQVATLEEKLTNIDESTQTGAVEGNRIRAEILRLRIQSRQASIDLQKAIIDNVIQQAFGAGAFEKIIYSQDKNVAAALEKGVFTDKYPHVTGSLDVDMTRRPKSPLEVLTEAYGVEDKSAQELVGFLEQHPTRGDEKIIGELAKTNALIDQRIPHISVDRLSVQAKEPKTQKSDESRTQTQRSRRKPTKAGTVGGSGLAELRSGAEDIIRGVNKLEDTLDRIEDPEGVDNSVPAGLHGYFTP